MTVPEDVLEMRIAPRRGGGDWTVRDWLAIDFNTEEGWQKAIDIFEDRIRGRYLDIVSEFEDLPYAGFAVLALDCLLIETLQQFKEGKPETPSSKSGEYFERFLTETSFGEFFDKARAKRFYEQIRCGILHQAEVKESSRVLIRHNEPLVRDTPDGKGLIINRKKFHRRLVDEFEAYVAALRDSKNSDLREKFKKKMDHICRIGTTIQGEDS